MSVLLRVRLHVAGVRDPGDRDFVCDHRVHLLRAQLGELELGLDLLPVLRLHRALRIHVSTSTSALLVVYY